MQTESEFEDRLGLSVIRMKEWTKLDDYDDDNKWAKGLIQQETDVLHTLFLRSLSFLSAASFSCSQDRNFVWKSRTSSSRAVLIYNLQGMKWNINKS